MKPIFRSVALSLTAALLVPMASQAQETTLLSLQDTPQQPFTLYSYTFQAQLAQTFLTFQFRQDPAYWYLDDVSVTNSANSQLLLNGGFEAGSYSVGGQAIPDSWTLIGQAGLQAGGTVDSSCAHTGTYCYTDGAVGGVDGLYQSFATTIGATYSLSFWLGNDGGAPATAVVQVGASENQGGTLVPILPATNIVAAGSPFLAAALGTSLNPVFDGGTLQLDSSGPVFSQNFTIYSTNGAIDTAGRTSTLSGVLSGPGGLTFSNTGSGGGVVLTNTNTYQGATTIDGGAKLALSGAGSISASSGVADNGVFDISGTTSGAIIRSLSGDGSVVLGSRNLTLSQAAGTFAGSITGTGGLAVAGGVETLSGTNLYTGGTFVSGGGKIIVRSDAGMGAPSGSLTLINGSVENTAAFTTARSINLIGNDVFANDAGATFDQTGVVSGSGHLTKSGNGTLVLAGDNRGWGQPGNNTIGGMTIDSGRVEVQNAYGLGYGVVAVNSGTIATTVNFPTMQSFQIAGPAVFDIGTGTATTLYGTLATTATSSCFEKTGAGTLAIDGTATLANGTCVEQGQLSANGTLTSTVMVAPGATLRGIGSIIGPVSILGTLAPGNSPGTLTAQSRVTMHAGSTYQEDINGIGTGTGPGNYSRLLVAGAGNQFVATGAALVVTLTGITGSAVYTPFQPVLGETFHIVTAQGGIIGTFASFGQPLGLAAGTRLAIFYDPFGDNSIDLRVMPTSYAAYLQGIAVNANARSVGNGLDQIRAVDQAGHAPKAQQDLMFAVGGLSAGALPSVATALAGEVHAELAALAPQAGQWLQTSVARQLEFTSTAEPAGTPQPGEALWFDSTAEDGKWDADGEGSAFTTHRTQIAVGFDLLAGAGNRAGVGFSHSQIDLSTFTGSGSLTDNIGFAYGQYSFAAVIVDGLVGGGTSHWGTSRADPLGFTAQSLDTNSGGGSAMASAGLRLPKLLGDLLLEPYARTLWQRESRAAFNEGSVQDALSAPDYAADGLRTKAGMLLGSALRSPLETAFTYGIDLGAGYDSGKLVHPLVAAALAGAATTITAPDVGRTFAQISLSGTARLGRHAFAFIALSDEARSGKSEEAGVDAGIRARF